jgi:N-acetylneuraminate synthase/sialic acid synthase
VIKREDLALKSPADGGLKPYEMDAVIGRTVRHPIAEDAAFTFDDLEEVLYAPEPAAAPAHGD